MAGEAEIPRLTVQDRMLLHLAEHATGEPEYEAPAEHTSTGLAGAVGIDARHVPQNVRPLITRGLVEERTAHVKAGRQRRRVYFLTIRGRSEAARLRTRILEVQVPVEVQGERKTMPLRDAVRDHFRGAPLLGLLGLLSSRGTLQILTAPVPPTATLPPEAPQLWPAGPNLARAEDFVTHYDWIAAAEAYQSALAETPPEQTQAIAEVRERLAFARFRAAFKSNNPQEFQERMETARLAYSEASRAYDSACDWGAPRSIRCAAMAASAEFWNTATTSEKKRLILEIHQRTRAALDAFAGAGESLELGRTYILLALTAYQFELLWDKTEVNRVLKEGVENGERAVSSLMTSGAPDVLAAAYAVAAQYLMRYSMLGSGLAERQKAQRDALDYWRRGRQISEDALLPTDYTSLAGDGTAEAIAIFDRAMHRAASTGDRYYYGLVARGMAFQVCWKHFLENRPTEKAALLQRALECAVLGKQQFNILGIRGAAVSGSFDLEGFQVDYDFHLAELETDPVKKRALLEHAVTECREDLKTAQDLGYPAFEAGCRRGLMESLREIARLETKEAAKEELLREALLHARDSIRICERGGSPWNLAHLYSTAAQVSADLASLIEDRDERDRALRQAITDMDSALKVWAEEQGFFDRLGDTGGYAEIAAKAYDLGAFLLRLRETDGDPEGLKRAAVAFGRAATLFEKLRLRSRIAECHWRIAQVHDLLSDHRSSARHFRQASESYEGAAADIPYLQELYKDLALYMNAWSEIEIARSHHARQEYGKAQESYERAANLHRFTRRWSPFASNYAAWAALESAEDSSRATHADAAIRAFHEARQLFEQTRQSLESAMSMMNDPDQRLAAEELASATYARGHYCGARVVLEEAKLLEARGDALGSSERFGDAAALFEDIAQSIPEEADRREIRLIMTFAKAWQAMAKAEATTSPDLHQEAARLFDEARSLSPTDAGKTLALAHSHFASALAAGATFSETRDARQHALAVRHLEAAADAYGRLALSGPSQYAMASKLLFDAYVYLDQAEREPDPTEKTKRYRMSERVLHASADAYNRAGQPGKERDVKRLLARAKEQRELAASLSDILRAPPIASSTIAFPTPTPTHEESVGVRQFEHADIRASLILNERSVALGGIFHIEIEIVNAGQGPAQLVKLEELRLDTFDYVDLAEPCVRGDHHLGLQGRRVNPLDTLEIKLGMRARETGSFRIGPRILYLDDQGRYRYHEPEPVEIVVTSPDD